MKSILYLTVTALLLTVLPSCLTRRIITENGHTVSSQYKVKRPLKEALSD